MTRARTNSRAGRGSDKRSSQPRVVLRAALTLDGKLDETLSPPPETADPAVGVLRDAAALAVDPAGVLAALPSEIRRVICLGPPEAFRALLDAALVDELEVTVRPLVDGRRAAPTLGGPPGADFFPASVACRLLNMEMRGGECVLRYQIVRRATPR